MRSSIAQEVLRSNTDEGVLTLTLNRPERRNAIDPALRDAPAAALDAAATSGVVITGAGLAPALACDWRIGAPTARILFREGRVWLVPAHGGLTRLVSWWGSRARRRSCSAARTSTPRPRSARACSATRRSCPPWPPRASTSRRPGGRPRAPRARLQGDVT